MEYIHLSWLLPQWQLFCMWRLHGSLPRSHQKMTQKEKKKKPAQPHLYVGSGILTTLDLMLKCPSIPDTWASPLLPCPQSDSIYIIIPRHCSFSKCTQSLPTEVTFLLRCAYALAEASFPQWTHPTIANKARTAFSVTAASFIKSERVQDLIVFAEQSKSIYLRAMHFMISLAVLQDESSCTGRFMIVLDSGLVDQEFSSSRNAFSMGGVG